MAAATCRFAEARRQLIGVRIEWLPEAERNRESQLAYIAERNLLAAVKQHRPEGL
jgi:hypothetical protein